MPYEKIKINGRTRYKCICHNVHCQKIFIKSFKPRLDKNIGKYCSRNCINEGRKLSNEHKEKIGNSVRGEKNGFYGKKHSEKTLKILKEKCGWILEEKYGEEKAKKIRKQQSLSMMGKNNFFYGKKHSEESRKRMSEAKSKMIAEGIWHPENNRGYKGHYKSEKTGNEEFYESLYELIRMKVLDLDDNVIHWTKQHGIRIDYYYDKKNRIYVPDLFIRTNDLFILEEIKGYEKKEKVYEKKNVAQDYCDIHGYVFKFLERNEINKMCIENFNKSYRCFVKEYKNDQK